MDFTNPTVIFNTVIVLLVLVIAYLLLRRSWAAHPDEELDIFEYGQLILQAEQTARIIVRGVQEAWRTGELEGDEREEDAIDQLAELYPELDEAMLRRIVKSAVYLLRQAAGKQVDRVMEQIPPASAGLAGGTGGIILPGGTISNSNSGASLRDITEGHTL